MALIPYKSAGDSLTAAEWNLIFAQQDALLTSFYAGMSPLFFNGEKGNVRKFYFFNPVAPDVNQFHPIVTISGSPFALNTLKDTGSFGFWRQQNDTAIANLINSLSVDPSSTPSPATSADYQVTRLVQPSQAAWYAAVYPENAYPGITMPVRLDLCMTVLKRGGNPITLAETNGSSDTANGAYESLGSIERQHQWDEVEIIVIGNISLPTGKYSLFRIHNFGKAPAVVNYGPATITVPAGGVKCLRKLANGTFLIGYNYFQQMVSGDPLFFTMLNCTNGGIANPINSCALGSSTGLLSSRNNYDLSKFWDMTSLYTNPSAPLLAPVALSTLIGDLLVTKGVFIVQHPTAGGALKLTFNGFAGLQALLSTAPTNASLTWSLNSSTGVVTVTRGGNLDGLQLDLLDIGTNLVNFLSGKQVYSPPTVGAAYANWSGFLKSISRHARLASSTSAPDMYGVTHASVAVDNTDNSTSANFTFMSTVQSLVNLFNQSSCALVSLQNFQIILTPFGPALLWQEVFTIVTGFVPSALVAPGDFLSLYVNPSSSTLIGQRGMLLSQMFPTNSYAPLNNPASNPAWHFPRTSRKYALARLVQHNLPDEPWNPTTFTPDTFGGVTIQNGYECGGAVVLIYAGARYGGTGYKVGDVLVPVGGTGTAATFQVTQLLPQFGTVQVVTLLSPGSYSTFPPSQFPGTIPGINVYVTGGSGDGQCVLTLIKVPHNFTVEPPNVKRFFEVKPAATEAVEPSQYPSLDKLQSRMGAQDSLPSYPGSWVDTTRIMLGRWLAGNQTDLALYKRALAEGGNVPTQQEQFDTSNATLMLPLQSEHYNLAASQGNGLPTIPARRSVAPIGRTTFTLDFTTMFLVDGGSGNSVSEVMTVVEANGRPIVQFTVTGVNGTGGVTSFGSVVVYPGNPIPLNAQQFDALNTPQRPFLCQGSSGSGCSIDVTSGDGSKLCFVPTYGPIVAPVPTTIPTPNDPNSTLAFNAFPRNAFFAWNGATPGGYDPVQAYFNSLGVTVQTVLPDGYGTPVVERVYDGSNYFDVQPPLYPDGAFYPQGFTPLFQYTCQAYRWITIDSARTLYSSLSVPFVINQTLLPLSFAIVAGIITGSAPSSPPLDIAGLYRLRKADFYINTSGAWTSTVPNGINCLGPLGGATRPWEWSISPFDIWEADLGVINASRYSFVGVNQWPAFLILLEGSQSLCVVISPYNLYYIDNAYASATLLNTLESAPPFVFYIDGTGGQNNYETMVQTTFQNAVMYTIPVDGAVNNNINPNSAGSSSVGAGSGSAGS